MRQGVTMGVSSRGVGSLARKGERNEVQEDFELICFDLVSSPSTPGAYLFLIKMTKTNTKRTWKKKKLRPEPEPRLDGGMGASIDLMKRLSDYLGN